MNTLDCMPRVLSGRLGAKLSFWVRAMSLRIEADEDFQEKVLSIVQGRYDFELTEEEKALIQGLLSEILSLSFIVQKHKEEIDRFYEEYNN